MKIHHVDQGTQEWRELRLGRPTASRFDCLINNAPVWIVTTAGGQSRHRSEETAAKKVAAWEKKGASASCAQVWEPSAQSRTYIRELLGEWATGVPADNYESQAMLRGRHLEDEAVAYYEMARDLTSDPGGFVTNDAGTVGCSPDRLVYRTGEHAQPVGGLEIKCPSATVHIGYLLEGDAGISDAYRHQVQGCLWLTGLKWWDTLSYHPDLPPALVRITRDEAWADAFAPLLFDFLTDLERGKEDLRARGVKAWGDTRGS